MMTDKPKTYIHKQQAEPVKPEEINGNNFCMHAAIHRPVPGQKCEDGGELLAILPVALNASNDAEGNVVIQAVFVVDDRKGSIDLAAHLPKSRTKVTRLEFADVAFEGKGPDGPIKVGIEYKKIPDVVDCIHSGRFAAHQLPGMAKDYDVIYLLVEGQITARYDGIMLWYHPGKKQWKMPFGGGPKLKPITENEFIAWLTTMEQQANCHTLWANDIQQSGRIVNSIFRWFQKPWDKHKSLNVFHTNGPKYVSLFNPISTIRKVASQLEGIGWEKSKAIEGHFKTIFDMAIADEKDWMEIPGIGKTLAQKIVAEIRGD
jgi:ERCC4-type nuclease